LVPLALGNWIFMFSRLKRTVLNRFGWKQSNRSPKTKSRFNALQLEMLERLILPTANPTVSFLNPETKPFIGENSQFTLQFLNTSPTDVGFTPYIDLYMPVTGIDGAGAQADDGINFLSATYLGSTLKTTAITLSADPLGVAHPFAKNPDGSTRFVTLAQHPGFKAGDQLVVIETPLGSFTSGQPPLNIQVNAHVSNLADLGKPLNIEAQAGFRFGGDPLDNPLSDPPILGSAVSQAFTPSLYRFTKENLAPENETATGPNFVQKYRLKLDVADGQTLANVKFQDTLPGTLQFVSVVSLAGGTETVAGRVTPSTVTSGGDLERVLQSVTGTTGSNDAELVFSYFVPIRDVANSVIINANSGDDVTIPNDATLTASWTPLDNRDSATSISETVPTTAQPLVAKSIATQKSVSVPVGGAVPGSTLTYTVQFQISDYFAFKNLVLTDLLGDGQSMVAGSATLSVSDFHGFGGSTSGSINSSNLTLTPNKAGLNGKDEIVIRISDELQLRGFSNGSLVGGMIPVGGTGGATMPNQPALYSGTIGTVTFQAKVQEAYDGTVPSGDQPLNPYDKLDNSVVIAGDLLNVNDVATPTGQSEEDDSAAGTQVPGTSLVKSIYAKNGIVGSYPGTTLVAPGDTITYRLQYNVPISDTENLYIDDFLPLPIFNINDSGSAITTQDLLASGTNNAPEAGKWSFKVTDSFHTVLGGLVPTVSLDSTANRVRFDFGTHQDLTNTASTVDILFTVTANSVPYADQLRLANRAYVSANNSENELDVIEAIAEVTSSEPLLSIKKGIVATDNSAGVFSPVAVGPVSFTAPGSAGNRFSGTINSTNLATTPINSNLSEVDADDLVTYALVVENTGSGRRGAFDVVIKDSPAAGMTIPSGGINLRVTDGAGNPLPFTTLGSGLFDLGIQLIDPTAEQGALTRGVDPNGNITTDGSNIVIVTYDLKVLQNPVLSQQLNTGSVTNFAATEGGPDFTGSGALTDDATITIGSQNLLQKALVTTEIVNSINALNEGVVGELVTYRVTIRVPEATMPNTVLTDTLDGGLAFVDLLNVTTSPGLTISGVTAPVVTSSGQKLTFNLGNISNTDRDNSVGETITFTYRAVVLNTAGNQGGTKLNNAARLTFDGLATAKQASASNITVIEPLVQVNKTAAFDIGDPLNGDANDPLTYTIVLKNLSGSQNATADAFDLTLSDPLPKLPSGSLIVSPTFTVNDSAGIVTSGTFELIGDDVNGYTLQTKAGSTFDLPVSNTRTITITIQGVTSSVATGLITPGALFTNTVQTKWTSLSGNPGTRSIYNANSVERTGAGGVNDYSASSSASLSITPVTIGKSVVSTSENATVSADRVVVGEIVRYRLVSVVPEGSIATSSLKLVDQLPVGMQFLADGTATIALISNGGLLSSAIPGGAAYVTGASATGVTPLFVLPGSTLVGGPFGNGTDVSFDLGTVTNSDDDSNSEYIVIEFNAQVLNVSANQTGVTLTNTAVVSRDGTIVGSASTNNLTVAEPNLTNVQKALVQADDVTPAAGPFEAGDTVRFRVSAQAEAGTNRSTAYDVRYADNLPSGKMTLVAGSVRVFRNGTQIFTGFSDASTSTTIDVTLDQMAPGDTVVLLFDSKLTNSVEAESTVVNTANLTFTSLSGLTGTAVNPTGSSVSGGSGSVTGERNGNDGPGGGLNDYAANAAANLLIASPSIVKTIFQTSLAETASNQINPGLTDFAVGEFVTYRLTVTLPEGTTPSLSVTDLLPASNGQMSYISSQVLSIGSQISGSSLAVGAPGTESSGIVSFNFGTVVNQTDGVLDGKDRIIIEVKAEVMNVVQNVVGTTLTNTGKLGFLVGPNTVEKTSSVTGEVVEPVLVTTKEMVNGATTVDTLHLDAGSVVTFRVRVNHGSSSTAPAYSVKIADTLPAGLSLVPGSVQVIHHPNYPSGSYDLPVISTNVGGNPNAFTVLFDYLDNPANPLALGSGNDVAGIEYQALVTSSVAAGTTITNTALVTYDSMPGELPSSTSPQTTRAYNGSDTSVILVNANSVSGRVFVDSNLDQLVTPGEIFLQGISVALVGVDHLGQAVSLNTTTDGNGYYIFSNLRPGSYTIVETQPVGFVSNGETPGTPFGNGSPGENKLGVLIPLGTNTPNEGIKFDFAEVTNSSISGFAYCDENNDGIFAPTDEPIANVAMTLTGTNLYGAITSVTVFTAADGSYQFNGLLPGTYTVTETQPVGHLDGKVTPGSKGGSGAVANIISAISIVPGDFSVGNNFAERHPIITNVATATFTYGDPFTFQFTSPDSPTFTATSLPPGVTLSSSGLLVGTGFLNAGTYNFTVTATAGLCGSTDQDFTLIIDCRPINYTIPNQTQTYCDPIDLNPIVPNPKNQAGSAFSTTQVDITNFTTRFTFQTIGYTGTPGDGITFTIQGNGSGALGANGEGLGYQGIGKSVAVKFDLINNHGEGTNSTGIYTNGVNPSLPGGQSQSLTPKGIDLQSDHPFSVEMTYNGSKLLVTVVDLVARLSSVQSYNIDIPGILGDTKGFVGFTGGTGTLTSRQSVLDWTYKNGPTTVIDYGAGIPSDAPGLDTNGTAILRSSSIVLTGANHALILPTGVNGQTVTVLLDSPGNTDHSPVGSYPINGTIYNGTGLASNYCFNFTPGILTVVPKPVTIVLPDQTQNYGNPVDLNSIVTIKSFDLAGSGFYDTLVDISGGFKTSFTFQSSPFAASECRGETEIADGITFTIQRKGTGALGKYGHGLGYQGITKSVAIKFDSFDNGGEGRSSTGLVFGGANPSTPNNSIDLLPSGIDLTRMDPITVDIAYNSSTNLLTVNVSQNETTTLGVVTHTATQNYTIDIESKILGDSAYFGFTGATGNLVSKQEITKWTIGTGSSSNNILDLSGGFAGTTSVPVNGSALINGSSLVLTGNAQRSSFLVGCEDETLIINQTSPGNTISSPVGTYPINGTPGNGTGLASNYVVTVVPGTLTVLKADLVIKAKDIVDTYCGATFSGTTDFLATGLAPGETIGSVTLTTNAPLSAGGHYKAGSWELVPSAATGGTFSSSNYNITYTKGEFQVNKKALTIRGNDKTKVYGDWWLWNGSEFSAPGLCVGDTIDWVSFCPTGDIASADVGLYDVEVSKAQGHGLENYDIVYEDGVLTVIPREINYTIANRTQNQGSPINLNDLTPNPYNQAGSAFHQTKVNIASFTSRFTFQTSVVDKTIADGFTFTIQNQDAQALGKRAGSLGYEGIGNSVAIKFDMFNNSGEGNNSTGLYTGGANPSTLTSSVNLAGSDIDLQSLHNFAVDMAYNGSVLNVTITDQDTGKSATQNYNINISSHVGGSTAWVGFTAGTGGLVAKQSIKSWDFKNGPVTAFNYNSFAGAGTLSTNGSAIVNGAVLALTCPSYGAVINTGIGDQNLRLFLDSTGNTAMASLGTYLINGNVSSGTGKASNYTVNITKGNLHVV